MNGPWDYEHVSPFAYGDETTYALGMAALTDCEVVEDWGCGTCWAKRFRTGRYIGVDQSPGYADVVADLRTYTSTVEGIFMRHVLEHNEQTWGTILDNALASFTRRLVLILFTPLAEHTHVHTTNRGIPDVSFAPADIEAHFGDRTYVYEDIDTLTQYGTERIYTVDA